MNQPCRLIWSPRLGKVTPAKRKPRLAGVRMIAFGGLVDKLLAM